MWKIIPVILSIFFLGSADLFAEIKAVSVKGKVAYKTARDWSQLTQGQVLPEGVKISTGANSYAELSLNSLDHRVKIKPFTVIQVFSKTDDTKSDTNVGLKRGNIVVKVPKDKKVKTVFKVTTPIATSSVRGTEEDIFYSPEYGMIIKVLEGIIEGSNRIDRTRYITGRQIYLQLWGEPDSQFILGDVRTDYLVDINGSGTTPDESGRYSNDPADSIDGGDAIIGRQNTRNPRLYIPLIWPIIPQ